jgi:hypothetical protein
MHFLLIIFLAVFTSLLSLAQNHQNQFNSAYSTSFYLPKGVLEAVYYTNTCMMEIKGDEASFGPKPTI